MLIYVRNSEGVVEEKFTYKLTQENITVSRVKPESFKKWIRDQTDLEVIRNNEYEISDLPKRFGSLAYAILDKEGKAVVHNRENYKHLVNTKLDEDEDNIQPLSSEIQERAIQELKKYLDLQK